MTVGRLGVALVIAVSLATAVTKPAAAKDGYLFASPFVVQLDGADANRSFVVSSGQDQAAVQTLIRQLSSQIQGASPTAVPITDAVPHFRLFINRMSGQPYDLPWFAMPSAKFWYYPAGGGSSAHLLVRIAGGLQPAREAWSPAASAVVAFMTRHTVGLTPAGAGDAVPNGAPYELLLMVAGAGALVIASAVPWQRRRRVLTPR
jgi:hypothetical protein